MGELQHEREQILSLLDSATETVRNAAFENLETNGYSDPIVIVIYADGRSEFMYPRYKNDSQRGEAFEKVSQFVRETKAAGMVVAMEMVFTPKGSRTARDTLFIARKSYQVSEYEAYILEEEKDKVTIGEKIGPGSITLDGMFDVFGQVN